jgi:hypothetical protein
MDGGESLLLRQGDIAKPGQFQTGAEGAGPGRKQTQRVLGTVTVGGRSGLLRQEMLQCLAVTPLLSAAVKKRAYSARPLSGAGVFVLVAGF